MATCGSLRSLFENPLPEKPSLIESLTWHQAKPNKPIDPSSLTELFGELHFHEKPDTPSSDRSPRSDRSSTESSSLDSLLGAPKIRYKGSPTESLQLCTEGLGSESSDDVEEDVMSESSVVIGVNHWGNGYKNSYLESERSKRRSRAFPPPISSIGRSGKPSVCFKSIREGGRFVLREMRIPTQEFLHASREDGRLKLHFVHPDSDIQEEEEEEEEGDDHANQENQEDEEEINEAQGQGQ